jgi:sarcosine oxidase subunit gamma
MAEHAALTVTSEIPLGKLVLRGESAIAATARATLGWPLPERINSATAGEAGRALKLGPDEYLLTVDPARVTALVGKLTGALAGRHYALVDISARLVAIEVDGPAARDILAAACPLDLHPTVFGPERASRTVFGKAEIILDCLDEQHLRLLTNRSFAAYVRRLLAEAGREFGLAQPAPP